MRRCRIQQRWWMWMRLVGWAHQFDIYFFSIKLDRTRNRKPFQIANHLFFSVCSSWLGCGRRSCGSTAPGSWRYEAGVNVNQQLLIWYRNSWSMASNNETSAALLSHPRNQTHFRVFFCDERVLSTTIPVRPLATHHLLAIRLDRLFVGPNCFSLQPLD